MAKRVVFQSKLKIIQNRLNALVKSHVEQHSVYLFHFLNRVPNFYHSWWKNISACWCDAFWS